MFSRRRSHNSSTCSSLLCSAGGGVLYCLLLLMVVVMTTRSTRVNAFVVQLQPSRGDAGAKPNQTPIVSSSSASVAIVQHRKSNYAANNRQRRITRGSACTTTALLMLLEVPEGFFTVTFTGLGILLSISKNYARVRMEESAWEQRLAEGREERMRRDPSVTELDLRRREAAAEWSAYGKPRFEEEAYLKEQKERQQEQQQQNLDDREWRRNQRRQQRRRGVAVMDRDDDDDEAEEEDNIDSSRSRGKMSDEEVAAFELEYGVEYDPYYDDPYTVDELPADIKYEVDRMYGDRVYDNGEVFYRDATTGLFYRQGAKPRNNVQFWN